MIWKAHNKKEISCQCGIKTYEPDGVCIPCKLAAKVEILLRELEVKGHEYRIDNPSKFIDAVWEFLKSEIKHGLG